MARRRQPQKVRTRRCRPAGAIRHAQGNTTSVSRSGSLTYSINAARGC